MQRFFIARNRQAGSRITAKQLPYPAFFLILLLQFFYALLHAFGRVKQVARLCHELVHTVAFIFLHRHAIGKGSGSRAASGNFHIQIAHYPAGINGEPGIRRNDRTFLISITRMALPSSTRIFRTLPT